MADRTKNVLVRACPGSGKTRVLVQRTLADDYSGHAAKGFLALAYNRDAAAMMKQRFTNSMRENGKHFSSDKHRFSTLHAFCYGLLYKSDVIGNRKVASTSQLHMILKKCSLLAGMMLDEDGLDELAAKIALTRSQTQVDDDQQQMFFHGKPIFAVVDQYKALKMEAGLLDFDDMLIEARHYLSRNADGLMYNGCHLLLDEAQDMNLVQADIIELLASRAESLFCVGDEDQAIYGFRGGNPAFMNDFGKRFTDSSEHILACNYRSTAEIVAAGIRLIAHNENRKPKLIQARPGCSGKHPQVVHSRNFSHEAVRLLQHAGNLHVNDEITTAVLFRTKKQGQLLAGKFRKIKQSGVNIVFSTFHSAKGLEFDNVIIAGACEGITPNARSLEEDGLEEERRLFYVAASRAKKHLIISVPDADDQGNHLKVSRFVEELTGRAEKARKFAWLHF